MESCKYGCISKKDRIFLSHFWTEKKGTFSHSSSYKQSSQINMGYVSLYRSYNIHKIMLKSETNINIIIFKYLKNIVKKIQHVN